jgi:hypothetical protein
VQTLTFLILSFPLGLEFLEVVPYQGNSALKTDRIRVLAFFSFTVNVSGIVWGPPSDLASGYSFHSKVVKTTKEWG